MTIKSGTTGEYRMRSLLFLAMCLGFAAWFGYDGLWGYPAQNLEWARQILPEKPADLRTNPKVLKKNLAAVQNGMTLQQVTALLGEPALVRHNERWFVGPATYACIKFAGEVVESIGPQQENTEKSEGDIRGQRGFAAVLLVLSLAFAARFVVVVLRPTVLDEYGVRARGRRVAWEQMTGLDTSNYDRKGWLDLEYNEDSKRRKVRLDSYHIARFDDLINEICSRKGFASPIRPRATDTAAPASSPEADRPG